jgi:hypothetical protein
MISFKSIAIVTSRNTANNPFKSWCDPSTQAISVSSPRGSEDQRFHIASIGKLFTAVALLRLVERGQCSLEDPITQWVDAKYVEGLFQDDASNGYFEALTDTPQWSGRLTLKARIVRACHL